MNYVFPVEVIVEALTEEDQRMICQRMWKDFGEALTYESA